MLYYVIKYSPATAAARRLRVPKTRQNLPKEGKVENQNDLEKLKIKVEKRRTYVHYC